jgi:hypothetical protein
MSNPNQPETHHGGQCHHRYSMMTFSSLFAAFEHALPVQKSLEDDEVPPF